MRCQLCNEVKLSNEFPRELPLKCIPPHAPRTCLECLIKHYGSSKTECPDCKTTSWSTARLLESYKTQLACEVIASEITRLENQTDPEHGNVINIMNLNGDKVSLPFDPSMSIRELKQTCGKMKEFGVQPEKIRLYLEKDQSELKDENDQRQPTTLQSLQVEPGSGIILMKSLYSQYVGINDVKEAPKDTFGNAAGDKYDLCENGSINGDVIAVLHLYTDEGFTFKEPQNALESKGFKVRRWADTVPPAAELAEGLKDANQLWLISNAISMLDEGHRYVITKRFNEGMGLFLWGDNAPYFVDANFIGEPLTGMTMSGDTYGDKLLSPLPKGKVGATGFIGGHPITTAIQNLYEGITVAAVSVAKAKKGVTPIMWGSDGNIITAIFDNGVSRCIMDGGFTRLYCNWDTAGTARFVVNTAVWLYNDEKRTASRLKAFRDNTLKKK
eukprot:Colp12_sorted_trinity150504_noHs@12439